VAISRHCNLHIGYLVLVSNIAMKGMEKIKQEEMNKDKREVKGKK
jgi:hypothetical protein